MLLSNLCSRCFLKKHVYSDFQRLSTNRLISEVYSRPNAHQAQRRSFFKGSRQLPQSIEYSKKQMVGFSMEQMFDVVSDVDNYQQFIPLCTQSIVTTRAPDFVNASLVIGYPPINDSYTANLTLVRPSVVNAECVDGKFFNHMVSIWRFSPGVKSEEQSCIIDFIMTIRFKSAMQSRLTTIFFDRFTRQMEAAFMKEVDKRYGPATMAPKKLIRESFIKD